MNISDILLMASFSFVMSITPGPVNLMIISSGINNGFKKTFSFISGATIAFTCLLILVALGLNTVLTTYPFYLKILEFFGLCFIMYLSYQLAKSNASINLDNKSSKSLKFYEGFLLQCLNPKAWLACISGISMFSHSLTSVITFICIYFFICYSSLSFWGILGEKATLYLNTNKKIKVFNSLMALTLFSISFYLLVIFLSKLL